MGLSELLDYAQGFTRKFALEDMHSIRLQDNLMTFTIYLPNNDENNNNAW